MHVNYKVIYSVRSVEIVISYVVSKCEVYVHTWNKQKASVTISSFHGARVCYATVRA